jgi:hypothetical protein
MAETFDFVRSSTPDSSDGTKVAGDTYVQGPDTIIVCASYLVYGPAGGPYERVDITTPLPVQQARCATSTPAQIDAVPSTATLFASNTARRGASVFNNATSDLYLHLGSGASTETFTLKIAAGGYYEVPFWWTGIVTGIWPSAASGTGTADGEAQVNEFTA